jgi:hypothetical protein
VRAECHRHRIARRRCDGVAGRPDWTETLTQYYITAYVGVMWCRRGGWWRSLATACVCRGMEAGDDVEVVLPQKNSVVWSRNASSEKAHPVRASPPLLFRPMLHPPEAHLESIASLEIPALTRIV